MTLAARAILRQRPRTAPRMSRPGAGRRSEPRCPSACARSRTPSRWRSTTARSRALIPYARNARTHSEAQVALIAGSIREFGFTNPVLVDGANGIIAGHGRVLAARKLGLATVPVIELGAPERGAEARLRPRRQPARRAGRLGPRAAGAGGRRTWRELGVDLGTLGFEAARARRAASARRGRPARGGDPGAARGACFSARRPLAPRAASAALRQLHRSGRRGAAARRRAAAPHGDRSAVWRELRPGLAQPGGAVGRRSAPARC